MAHQSSPITSCGVKYIGSKAALLPEILSFVDSRLPPGTPRTLLDVFTGTTRVAQAFRSRGWQVTTSDLSWASEAYAHAFLLRTAESGRRIPSLLSELQRECDAAVGGAGGGAAAAAGPGWIERTYCDVSGADGALVRMWKPANGRKADIIRDRIAAWETSNHISHHEAMILTASLIFALDKVDSSVGVQQAYLKSWAARASNPLKLEDLPFPASGPPGQHFVGDATLIPFSPASVAYLDPPYSGHSYATYYHIWDSITRWDKPPVGLKTNRRLDRVSGSTAFDASMVSPWNSRRKALPAFLDLIAKLPVHHVVISYNDESLVPIDDLETALKNAYGATAVYKYAIPYRRNIMCQIGNAAEGKAGPDGEGAKTENTEVLFWVTKH